MSVEGRTGQGRLERLRAGVAAVRGRRAQLSIGRSLMTAGAVLSALGIVLILLAWLGASRTPYLFEQVPYLISGGLLGVALAILGGLSYFAYWMTRALEEGRAQADRTAEALGRIEALLAAGAVAGTATAKAASTNGTPFVKTAKGTMFHRPDCPVVAGRSDVTPVASSGEGFVPCRVCDPLTTAGRV